MRYIWPLKNRENRSVTRAIKNAYFQYTNPCVWKHLTFVAFSSNMTSEMTQFTVFSRLYQKKSYFSFVFKFGSIVRLCEQIYISTSDVYLWDTYLVAIWILFATSLYICGKNRGKNMHLFLQFLNNDRKVIDCLRHISESCAYF